MSQNAKILQHLKTGRSVTPLMALERWGVFRLAARIGDLRRDGWRIVTHTIRRGGKAYAGYLMDRA